MMYDFQPKTPDFEKLLREELGWVMELHELEPEIKCIVFIDVFTLLIIY